MGSVERQLEPNLAEKLVVLCGRLEALVRAASSLNDNARCTVDGAYLATTVMKIDGYYHVNDNVLHNAIEECELAFGSNTSRCHTEPNCAGMPIQEKNWFALVDCHQMQHPLVDTSCTLARSITLGQCPSSCQVC